MTACGTCAFWKQDFFFQEDDEDDEDDDDLGECSALDPESIPFSWRYCPRERMATRRIEGHSCPCYKGN